MGVDKITVSLPAELVGEIDRLSAVYGMSRSAVVREATARYVSERRSADAAAQRRRAADDLLAFLGDLDDTAVLDDRPTLEILRELRGPLDEETAR
jgi:Arc/MetJ-type ribon-helix-helix transcriptional regulator